MNDSFSSRYYFKIELFLLSLGFVLSLLVIFATALEYSALIVDVVKEAENPLLLILQAPILAATAVVVLLALISITWRTASFLIYNIGLIGTLLYGNKADSKVAIKRCIETLVLASLTCLFVLLSLWSIHMFIETPMVFMVAIGMMLMIITAPLLVLRDITTGTAPLLWTTLRELRDIYLPPR